jgi:hypothetical protein
LNKKSVLQCVLIKDIATEIKKNNKIACLVGLFIVEGIFYTTILRKSSTVFREEA